MRTSSATRAILRGEGVNPYDRELLPLDVFSRGGKLRLNNYSLGKKIVQFDYT
jgi:hypothetical protein